ncbi:MAG: hypothetical protein V7700_16915 [Halioglobus sp.]
MKFSHTSMSGGMLTGYLAFLADYRAFQVDCLAFQVDCLASRVDCLAYQDDLRGGRSQLTDLLLLLFA